MRLADDNLPRRSSLALPETTLRRAPAADPQSLADAQGRGVGYLRLSLTPACTMRCTYCRPGFENDLPDVKLMTPREIHAMVRHLVDHWGLRKVRLTGGEPTTRKDLLEIIEAVASIDGIDDLAMTTNGLTLPRQAVDLKNAGLSRLNISLDSLDPVTFEAMTGVAGPARVIQGIDAGVAAGLSPIKINTVVLAGQNDRELPALVKFAADRGVEVRFIELMPMGPLAGQWSQRFVDEARMKEHLATAITHWELLEQGHDAARRYHVRLTDGRWTTIGFITPMSCNFCAACNRLRITAAGDVYPCLMDQPRGSIAPAFAQGFDGKMFDHILHDCLQHKAPEHPINGFTQMTILGG